MLYRLNVNAKLMEDYNSIFTKDGQQKQYILKLSLALFFSRPINDTNRGFSIFYKLFKSIDRGIPVAVKVN